MRLQIILIATLLLVANFSQTIIAEASVTVTPSGNDDTVQLQNALNVCSGANKACTIILSSGTFYTDVLLVHDFRGEIIGQGAGQTIIRPIVGRPLRSTSYPFLNDPTIDEPYPILLHFADGGDISLSNFTLEFPGDMEVETYTLGTPIDDALLSAIMMDGTESGKLKVTGLEIIATANPDLAPFGSNVLNAIRFEGQIRLTGPSDEIGLLTTPLADGKFTAKDTHIVASGLGFALRDVNTVKAHIINNTVNQTRLIGVFLTDMGDSKVTVSDNQISCEIVGVQILRGVRPPELPSDFNISANSIVTNEFGNSLFGPGDGIVFADITDDGGIDQASLRNNSIVLGVESYEAIYGYGDRNNVRIKNNSVTGTAVLAGITIEASDGTLTRHNEFEGLTPGLADVWLTDTTSNCVVNEPNATVLDEGTNNRVKN